MELIADILLVAGALGAGLYCFVLSRRLKRFTDLEQGVGGAVAVLSTQAGELKKSLDSARTASDQSGDALKELTERAQSVAQRLELMMASMHDVIPDEKTPPAQPNNDIPEEAPALAEADQSEGPDQTVDSEPETAGLSETDSLNETLPAQSKAPEGLMFFRHDRKRSEAVE